jgi:hypothetical protein
LLIGAWFPALAQECPEGYRKTGEQVEETADATIIHPVCQKQATPKPQPAPTETAAAMTESAADLVGIFNKAASSLKLPKGPATNRKLSTLNCQAYFRAVASLFTQTGKPSWEHEFSGLNADGIAKRLKDAAQHGGNWEAVDVNQAQERANSGMIVVGASPKDKGGYGHLGFVIPLPPGLDESKFSGRGPFVRDGNEHQQPGQKLYPSSWGAVKASKAFMLSRTKWYVYVPSKP